MMTYLCVRLTRVRGTFIYIVSQNTVLTTSEFDILEKVYVSAKTRCHRETVYTVSPLDNNEFNNNYIIIITFEK